MPSISSVKNHEDLVYKCKFFVGEEKQETKRKFVKNNTVLEDRSLINTFSSMNSRTKGIADSFALIGRSTKFITPHMPEGVADWTKHVSSSVLKARSILSVPYMWTAVRRFNEKITFRSICDLVATTFHASALFVMGAASQTVSSIGSTIKAFVDSVDTVDNVKKFFETRELCAIASKEDGVSEQVKSGLNTQWYDQLCKIIRYSLTAIFVFFFGFAFCFAVTLPTAVGTALLGLSVISAISAIAGDYVLETADYIEFKT